MMKEITEHKIYELLNGKYNRTELDYVFLSGDSDYEGIETHRIAVIEALGILSERRRNDGCCLEYEVYPEKMNGTKIDMDELLQPSDDYYYDHRPKRKNRCFSAPDPITYQYAFLEPPHGVPYLNSDFISFNSILFPNSDSCEAYRWNDDFSDYFDAGKEWWGTGLWSVYDTKTGIMVIIGASLTD